MEFLILEMREDSGYADTEQLYVFPRQYLKNFSDLPHGGQIALIYEPRRNGGRQAFVAWGRVTSAPATRDDGYFQVSLGDGLISFDQPVPFTINGTPVEHRLREIERRRWGSALQGQSVRTIPAENAWEILSMGMPAANVPSTLELGTIDVARRGRVVVERLERDGRFRDRILHNYGFTCAVTGLAAGPNTASRLSGLLEAAHVQPVAADGPDKPTNGIALTPTVHRMFDAGLITLRARGNEVVVRTSPQLLPQMLTSPSGTRLLIEDGQPIRLPADPTAQPDPEFLDYHRKNVFRSAA